MLNLDNLRHYASVTAVLLDEGYQREREIQSEIDRLNDQRRAVCEHCHALLSLIRAANALLPSEMRVETLDSIRARDAKPS